MRVHIAAVATMLGVLSADATVLGQVRAPVSGGSSMFGTQSLGSNITPGTRTFGGTSRATNVGAVGPGGLNSQNMMGNLGQVTAGSRFVRGSQQAGQFVGADTADARFVGAEQAAQTAGRFSGQQFMPGAAGGAGRAGQRQGFGQRGGQGGRGRVEIRTSLRVAFTYTPRPSTDISTGLVDRLSQLGAIKTLSPLEVVVKDGTATLRGVVATERDRGLLAQLTRLEGGIRSVKNELVVAQAQPDLVLPNPSEPAAEDTPEENPPSGGPPDLNAPSRAVPEPSKSPPSGND